MFTRTQTQTQVALDPSTQPNALLTRTPQMPVASPFPPHLVTQQSHPGSPLPQSPILNPSQPMQVYPPQTPVQQPVPYAVTPASGTYLANTSPGIGVNPGFVAITSPTFQTPMSRLGYHSMEGPRYSEFPDSNSLEPLPQSQTNPDLFSKSLVESWAQSHESLLKQVSADLLPFLSLPRPSFLSLPFAPSLPFQSPLCPPLSSFSLSLPLTPPFSSFLRSSLPSFPLSLFPSFLPSSPSLLPSSLPLPLIPSVLPFSPPFSPSPSLPPPLLPFLSSPPLSPFFHFLFLFHNFVTLVVCGAKHLFPVPK